MEISQIINQLQAVAPNPVPFAFACGFILLDVLTGYAQAVANKDVSSAKMRNGFWHKLALVFAILAAGMVDIATGYELDLGFDVPIFEASCLYVMVMELTSIAENIKRMNQELADSRLLSLLEVKHDGKGQQ